MIQLWSRKGQLREGYGSRVSIESVLVYPSAAESTHAHMHCQYAASLVLFTGGTVARFYLREGSCIIGAVKELSVLHFLHGLSSKPELSTCTQCNCTLMLPMGANLQM